MNSNDLRIGNWVLTKDSDIPLQVYEIYSTYIAASYKDTLIVTRDYDVLEPLPLTNSILGNNGWTALLDEDYELQELYLESDDFKIKLIEITRGDEHLYDVHISDGDEIIVYGVVKYVHELQNLLHALRMNDDIKLNNDKTIEL